MLQPELARLQTEGNALVKSCDEDCPTGNSQGRGQRESEEGDPFAFAPQLIRLHKDHELFEVTQQQHSDTRSP